MVSKQGSEGRQISDFFGQKFRSAGAAYTRGITLIRGFQECSWFGYPQQSEDTKWQRNVRGAKYTARPTNDFIATTAVQFASFVPTSLLVQSSLQHWEDCQGIAISLDFFRIKNSDLLWMSWKPDRNPKHSGCREGKAICATPTSGSFLISVSRSRMARKHDHTIIYSTYLAFDESWISEQESERLIVGRSQGTTVCCQLLYRIGMKIIRRWKAYMSVGPIQDYVSFTIA